MSVFRFIGDYALLREKGKSIELTRFGQKIEIGPEMEAMALLERASGHPAVPLLPEEKFNELGFTEDELKQFPSAASHDESKAPKHLKDAMRSFLEKKSAAIEAMHEFVREHALKGTSQPEASRPESESEESIRA